MIYMFLSNNSSWGDINSSNLPCFLFKSFIKSRINLGFYNKIVKNS